MQHLDDLGYYAAARRADRRHALPHYPIGAKARAPIGGGASVFRHGEDAIAQLASRRGIWRVRQERGLTGRADLPGSAGTLR